MSAADPPRCAVIARADGYLPAGTAASAPVFVLIEVPLPWPSEITEHPLLQPVAPLAAAHQARVQGLVPDPAVAATPEEMTRVVVYRRPAGPFRRYDRDEEVVPTADLALAVEHLLTPESLPDGASRLATQVAPGGRGGPGASGGAGMPPTPDAPEPGADGGEPGPVVDVLVCTHGRRDVCCGGDGSRTYHDLMELGLPGVRVWRTSHTGGHRFAPTALTFPNGRAWASVDAETLAAIVVRTLEPAAAAAHDRGCAAFADPFVQAADGAVLGVEGWPWLDLARTAHTELLADDRRAVTITAYPGPDGPEPAGPSAAGTSGALVAGEAVVYRAEVVVRRVVPVPDCGRPIEEARKSSQELEVVSLDQV